MGIESTYTRLKQAKEDLKAAINAKGGALEGESISEYASVVENLSTGGTNDYSDSWVRPSDWPDLDKIELSCPVAYLNVLIKNDGHNYLAFWTGSSARYDIVDVSDTGEVTVLHNLGTIARYGLVDLNFLDEGVHCLRITNYTRSIMMYGVTVDGVYYPAPNMRVLELYEDASSLGTEAFGTAWALWATNYTINVYRKTKWMFSDMGSRDFDLAPRLRKVYIDANNAAAYMPDAFRNCRALEECVIENCNFYNYSKSLAHTWDDNLNLRTLTFNNITTIGITSISQMCQNCLSLTSLDLSGFDTSAMTTMSYAFYGCQSLAELNMDGWDVSKVTSMYQMFYRCTVLTGLDLSGWTTSALTNAGYMFYQCYGLTSLDLSGWDVSKVTTMRDMFYYCTHLKTLNLTGWNPTALTSMAEMFYGCYVLESLDFSGWDTGTNYLNLTNTFNGCASLTELSVGTLNTSKETDMRNTFYGCTSLKTLDITGWDFSLLKTSLSMFSNCTSLETLIVGDLSVPVLTSVDSMFANCTSLTNIVGSMSNIKAALSLKWSPLTRESALVIINGLVDLTGSTAKTLTLSSTTKALLTDEDLEYIASINWTLA